MSKETSALRVICLAKSQFDRIYKFVEAHSYYFTSLDSLHDNITTDTDDDSSDDSDLVADVDPDTLIGIIRTELKMVRLTRAFTISLKLGFIPHVCNYGSSPLYAHQA